MRRIKAQPQPAEQPKEELTAEELEAQQIVELPDREAISVVNGSTAITMGAAATAGLLPDGK